MNRISSRKKRILASLARKNAFLKAIFCLNDVHGHGYEQTCFKSEAFSVKPVETGIKTEAKVICNYNVIQKQIWSSLKPSLS